MINLVLNEIKKIVRKKSFFIMLFVMLAFCILTNSIYKSIESGLDSVILGYEISDEELEEIKNDDEDFYLSEKTNRNIHKYIDKYDNDSWQYNYLLQNENVEEYYTEITKYESKLSNDEIVYNEAKSNLDELLKKVETSEWEDLVKEELEQLKLVREQLDDDSAKEAIDIKIETLNMRLEKNIPYGAGYLNIALIRYEDDKTTFLRYKNIDVDKLDREERNVYYELKEEILTNNYIINNKVDSNNYFSLAGILRNFFNEYTFIIVLFIFMIGGSIVSQEFNDGTIKLLLIKPYTRAKILLSKYIAVILGVFFACFAMLILQIIVGGLIFGFDTLSTPALVYSDITDTLKVYNIIYYVFLNIIGKLPYLLILGTLSFALSTILNNTTAATALSFVVYILANTSELLINLNKWWVKFIVCFNWNFTPYILGKSPDLKGINLPFSLVMCVVTLLIIIIPTFIIFNKKDVTNA